MRTILYGNKPMKIIIAGTRTYYDYEFIKRKVIDTMNEHDWEIAEILSGGQKGVDRCGERLASEIGIRPLVYAANWKRYGMRAGPIRNLQMARDADILFAFWDGKSPGTRSMLKAAIRYKLKIFTFWIS